MYDKTNDNITIEGNKKAVVLFCFWSLFSVVDIYSPRLCFFYYENTIFISFTITMAFSMFSLFLANQIENRTTFRYVRTIFSAIKPNDKLRFVLRTWSSFMLNHNKKQNEKNWRREKKTTERPCAGTSKPSKLMCFEQHTNLFIKILWLLEHFVCTFSCWMFSKSFLIVENKKKKIYYLFFLDKYIVLYMKMKSNQKNHKKKVFKWNRTTKKII